MIGSVEVKCSAHRPNQPLAPIFTYVGSPSNMRIIDVPKGIGQFSVDVVRVVVDYPNNKKEIVEAVRQGCVYVATIPSCEIAGKTIGGVEIICDCTDENGNPVEGFVIGKGDVFVLERDSKFSKLIEKWNVRYLDELPTTPAKGDLIAHNGSVQLFDGENWISLGSDPTVIDRLEEEIAEVDGKVEDLYTRVDEVSKKVTSEDGKQYINGEGEVWTNEAGYTPWVVRYVGYDPYPQANIYWSEDEETGFGMWLLLIDGRQQLTNPNPISTDKTATHLEFKHNDDGEWYDMVADREAVESQWTKKDDLATKSEITLIKSMATVAKETADQVHDDIWALGGVKDDITTLQDTKASVDVTNGLRTDVENCQEQIGQLFESKITEPESIAKGQILKVVEVQKSSGASLQGVAPPSTPTLQWEAVDPDVIPTKTSELDNDSEFVDKDFVNSSIATNTANFKGTFNNESEFPTEATNNDYLFWKTVDEDGNTIYKRYKYIASTSTWTYEYTLNNSSFTAQQWATINGGPYATQTSLNDKQDKLPYNDQWDVYDVGCWSAVNATRDVNGNWIDETYATKAELPTKVSQLENDSDFATKTYVDEAIGQVLNEEEF